MSIDKLRYFSAVVETKNLRKAAELVGISPPSMSKAISTLEEELGHKLIFPEGRGIGITAKGLEVYQHSASLLEEYRRFYERLKTGTPRSDKLRIATFEVFSSYFISTFLNQVNQSDVLLLELTPGKIEQAIRSGLVDVGITYLPAPDSALEYREIGSFSMSIYGKEKWKNTPFSEWPFVVPTTELRIHSSKIDSLDLWPRKAPKRNIKFQFELLETALQTTRMGLSVIHCPSFIVRLQNEQVKPSMQLTKLPPPPSYKEPKPTKMFLVGRKGASIDDLERKLAKFARSIS
jgi:DNA-binding transcriptional LysR family regulator